ncbi:class I SAM-dependent methyltransferase [Gemelliphila palaticanis]|uniref:Class I SAM-dependent methyltransferase n=1 Tax=Gemelliphila palaticanis TaxID=81950 RepID=A0ABX2SY54_9BACL|nr:class I SAM-dependent methyltransferase [Gemella palaticanis]MBF0714796.1 class I SAM-dependent methyltransferase [Gemella palaticanis]NYS46726.1 class I SAM-dependent methyltransferase [Gemella palaticanis]
MSKIEELFYKIDKETEKLKQEKNYNYLRALSEYLELKNDEDYFFIVENYSKEEIKKVYHFLVLKAFKEMQDINYNVTPEIISTYINSIIESIFSNKKLNVVDFASGSGNILLGLNPNSNFTSIDADILYSKLQQNIYNILQIEANIINQDVLKPINIDLQDLIVSDVPYGYYADEDNSLNYKLCSQEGYSLNSLLFIEQTANYLKEDGVGILILPKQIMELPEGLKSFIEKEININAFILLPEDMFKNKEQQKVIVLITKKDQKLLPNKIFLAELPSYQNKQGYQLFIEDFKNWLNNK